MERQTRQLRVLAISSGGGHWEQMLLLRDSFKDHDVLYANTLPGLAERAGIENAIVISDCNRDLPMQNFKCAWEAFNLIRKFRPDIILTTGAAPGLLALGIGRLFGAKGVWIDSVANSRQLSMSGKLAGRIAHLHLTQWEHLSVSGGPKYMGSVI